MSRISDMLIEISEYLDTGCSDEDIATIVGCPVSWVTQEREEYDRLMDGVFEKDCEIF